VCVWWCHQDAGMADRGTEDSVTIDTSIARAPVAPGRLWYTIWWCARWFSEGEDAVPDGSLKARTACQMVLWRRGRRARWFYKGKDASGKDGSMQARTPMAISSNRLILMTAFLSVIYKYIYIHTYIYTHTHTCTHICKYIYMHIYICIHAQTYAHTYISIYI